MGKVTVVRALPPEFQLFQHGVTLDYPRSGMWRHHLSCTTEPYNCDGNYVQVLGTYIIMHISPAIIGNATRLRLSIYSPVFTATTTASEWFIGCNTNSSKNKVACM